MKISPRTVVATLAATLAAGIQMPSTAEATSLGPVPFYGNGIGVPRLMAADGRTFAVPYGTIIVYDSSTRTYQGPRNSRGDFVPGNIDAISSGGDFVVYDTQYDPEPPQSSVSNRRLYLWNRTAAQITWISRIGNGDELPPDNGSSSAVSTDGATVAFVSGGNLVIWSGGAPMQVTPASLGATEVQTVRGVAMTPDAASVVTDCYLYDSSNSTYTPALVRYSVSASSFTLLASGSQYNDVQSQTVSDDGRFVCFISGNALIASDTNGDADVYVLDTNDSTLVRASVSSSGTEANGNSQYSQISGNGRYVVFQSDATNLVSVDFNNARDVFRHDLTTGETRKLSLLNDGSSISNGAYLIGVSTDGSRLSMGLGSGGAAVWDENAAVPTAPGPRSPSPGLAAGTLNQIGAGVTKVLGSGAYVLSGTTLVETSTGATEQIDVPTGTATSLAVTANNRFIVFATRQGIDPADTNGLNDLYLRDRQTKTTTKLTKAYDGSQTLGNVDDYDSSDDGALVAFTSSDISLMPGLNGHQQLFLMNTSTGALTLATTAMDGKPTSGNNILLPRVSSDGRFIAFISDASDLVTNDDTSGENAYRYDSTAGTIVRVTIATSGANFDSFNVSGGGLAISGDGSVIAFATEATNVVAGEDPNALPGGGSLTQQTAHLQRYGGSDVFVYDFNKNAVEAVSVDNAGERPINSGSSNPVSSTTPSLNFDGSRVAFNSNATDLVADPTSGGNVFLRDRKQSTTVLVSQTVGGSPLLNSSGTKVFFGGYVQDTAATATPTPTPTATSTTTPAPAPSITSPLTATATTGQLFTYEITATNSPSSYAAMNLPDGLSFDPSLATISGKPTTPGNYTITLGATNSNGTTSADLALSVQAPPPNTPVTISGTSITIRVGDPFRFQVITSGGSSNTRLTTTGLPDGLVADAVTGVISGKATTAGSYAITLTVSDGSSSSSSILELTVTSDPALPVIVSPDTVLLTQGQAFSYLINAPAATDPTDATTYSLIGTLPSGLFFDSKTGVISGSFMGRAERNGDPPETRALSGGIIASVQLAATNKHGTAIKPLTFLAAPAGAVNISTRMSVGTQDNVLIAGFIITGNAPKKVLLRAIGPSLGIDGALQHTTLDLYQGTNVLASDDGWRSTQEQEIKDTGIPPTSDYESAMIATLVPNSYTAIVRGAGDTSGIGLAEVYDLGTASLDTSSASRLANISTRGTVLTGDNVMIGGFIVSGASAKILARGIGPSLASSGVTDALNDPILELHDGSGALVVANDDWRSTQEQDIIATGVPPQDDRESAIIATLTPGSYTAILRGKGDTTGVALVEVYSLQQ